ncbi:MAG: C25 family cysteine peptidase [Candidatus Thorarchaeota archaeon]
MREFKSLKPTDLMDDFDSKIHSEEPVVTVEESKSKIVISYSFPGFYFFEETREVAGEKIDFKKINIAKTGFLAESGRSLIPSFGRYVQIPFNCDFSYEVKTGKEVMYEDVMVLPAQEKLLDGEQKHEFEYDEEFYSSEDFYPESLVEVKGPFEIDGYNALLLHVRPLQYSPSTKKLKGYGNVTVTIKLTEKKKKDEAYPMIDPEENREAFGNPFVNPRRRVEERVELRPGPLVLPAILRGPEFLIIYHEDMKKAAQKLTSWKRYRGLRTTMVSINDVGNSVAEIKKYIRNMRKNLFSRLRYVLLMGDTDMITPETIPGGVFGSNVTDFYYSTSKDPADGNDFVIPWLSIGRIPVRDGKQALGVVDQIIRYERNPPCDSEYYRRMSFAAYFEDGYPMDGTDNKGYLKTMEDIRENMVSLGFDVERVYVSNNPNLQRYNDGTIIPNEVINSILDEPTATSTIISATAEGQLIIGHRDHGDDDGWSHPSFKNDDIDAITSEYPSIFYSINCLTGKYDLAAPTESFAEKLLRYNGGAPSLVAATRLSHTWLNNDLMKAMFDAMWGGVLPTFPASTASYSVRFNRLGDILNYGKTYLPVTTSGSDAEIKDHFEIYHVIGDPTLELWKSEPSVVNVAASIMGNYLSVKLSICPNDAIITVWYQGKEIKRIKPSSTHFKVQLAGFPTFPLPPARRKVLVCFWAPGCRFRMVVVKY